MEPATSPTGAEDIGRFTADDLVALVFRSGDVTRSVARQRRDLKADKFGALLERWP